jgi:hypothetical protein
MILTRHKRFVEVSLCWLISMVATGAVYTLLLLPLNRWVGQIEKQVNERVERLNHAAELVSQESLHKSEKQLAGSREQFDCFVTKIDRASDFALNVSEVAKQLQIKNLSTKGRAEGIFFEIPNCSLIEMSRINISWKGSYPQFIRLVNTLERHQPAILIDRFMLFRPETDSKFNEVSMDLTMLVEKRRVPSDGAMAQAKKGKTGG